MRPNGLKYRNRVELPSPIIASLMRLRADGATYQAVRDHLKAKHGLTLSVSKVYDLCKSFPTPKAKTREAVRKAVADGLTRREAAEIFETSLTTTVRWCAGL